MKHGTASGLSGELWGGLAAMLVALPSAIAFGVTIFAPLGEPYAAQGAMAGIVGALALGLVAPVFGGTSRLISAPCAPAAAVCGAFALEMASRGVAADAVVLQLALMALLCGALQFAFGLAGIGRLIKYMPYPVVSGYLSGVGLVIIASQAPKLLGAPAGGGLLASLADPSSWNWQPLLVGAVTIAAMLGAGRVIRTIPAAILGLTAGVGAYFALAMTTPALLELEGNPLVVGPLGGAGSGLLDTVADRWQGVAGLAPQDLKGVLIPALTLAVLLSIDTLKTCVVLDALTRSRHDSNRELIGQGLANIVSTAAGGVPGAGQMGATLVNMSSGGRTRLSSILEGALCLLAFLVLGELVAWVPIASLAAILIVIGVRMIDWHSLALLRSRETAFDFVVILSVIVVAKSVSLIAASGVGIALAIVLYLREQMRGSVVARKTHGSRTFSKQVRLPGEHELLEATGERTAIFELQGSLFFGTTDQLYTALEPELTRAEHLILDFRRVQSIDVTAAHMLDQIQEALGERHALLLFSALPRRLPSGRDVERYFSEVGLVREHGDRVRIFDELDQALEWVEERVLRSAGSAPAEESVLALHEIDILKGRKPETVEALRACMEMRHVPAGETIFRGGDAGDELYLIRRGRVRILLPLASTHNHHLATFGRGDFFGEMAFLDRSPRSADAVAVTPTDLFVLSRQRFDGFAAGHKRVGMDLLEGLARSLSVRLRYANDELHGLQD